MVDPYKNKTVEGPFASGGVVITDASDDLAAWRCGDGILCKAQADIFQFPEPIVVDPISLHQDIAKLFAEVRNMREVAK